ncbi:hypothetical protein DFR70_10682 [Nocardia tenerifensis]|uniref:Uncharacterized protein n=1 Tax=Nocardia tenerifensis TaxID=228006 RepID=A0A318JZT9_9NOCA|nr:hypothetical protein [Nocardia tenerifensis]PXX63028.1 hypothetical protein DFR70_10682 [Nocardia tenerifensis]
MAESSGEPVLITLTTPARRSLVDGLVRAPRPGDAPVLDADAPDSDIADFLAAVVHTDTGFVARTGSGERALAIIAATVAALCGEDIRAALTTPDTAFLTALKPPAVEAFRGVLLAIETDFVAEVTRALAPLDGR